VAASRDEDTGSDPDSRSRARPLLDERGQSAGVIRLPPRRSIGRQDRGVTGPVGGSAGWPGSHFSPGDGPAVASVWAGDLAGRPAADNRSAWRTFLAREVSRWLIRRNPRTSSSRPSRRCPVFPSPRLRRRIARGSPAGRSDDRSERTTNGARSRDAARGPEAGTQLEW